MTGVRRLLATALCVLPIALVAGCGSGSSNGAASSLDEALGYLPKSAPFVMSFDTDLNGGQWKSLIANTKKFPFSGQIEAGLDSSLKQQGFDFNKDIKPLLGNKAVIGFPTAQALNSSEAVGALQVKDKGKLSDLLSKSNDIQKDGSSNGATLYKSSGTELAQKDDVLVVADNKQQVTAALEQRDRDDRLTEGDFNGKVSDLPSDALVRLFVDAGSLLKSSPEAAQASKVKWVGALTTVGFTASSQNDGIAFDFNAKTDSSKLSESDLPIASGDASPPTAERSGEIGFGIRNLTQTERFAEGIAQIVNPAGYSDFQSSKRKLGASIGIDVERDLIGQFTGNSTAVFNITGDYAVRSEPKDPAAFSKTLAKFAKVAPAFADGAGLKGARLTRAHGLYRLTGRNGKSIYYGMVGKVFAVSNDPERLAQVASASPQPVPGAKGAVVVNADAGKLVAEAIRKAAGGGLGGAFGGSLLTAPLGNLTGSLNSSTSGLKGHFKLEIH